MANDTAGSPVVHLPWAGKQVPLEEVDLVLTSLWKGSVDNMRTAANLNVRTSVLNLVICVPDVASARYASKLLRELASTHLARATIVILDNTSTTPSTLTSWVTLRCFSMISDIMRHCFEQTTILSSGNTAEELIAALPSLLQAHLPVYLWWIGETGGKNTAVFRSISALSQRVVVDSATFLQPEHNMHDLAVYRQASPSCALSDLNWGRLTPWRELIAQFFDVPTYLPFLSGIEKIEIAHTTTPGNAPLSSTQAEGQISPNQTCALLLSGWLKARLNLSLAEQGGAQRDTERGIYQWPLWQADEQAALMQIEPYAHTDLEPGSIFLIRLTCRADGKQAVFTIQREDKDHVLTTVDIPGDTRPSRAVQLPVRYDASELLRNELEIMGHDEFFEQALQEVALLLAR